ncbi:MAG TPA: Yip1 family protein [Pyrinomonadaceae bacterium]|nr:Yip1 family protein [Pyrinomonadaceae bacterium]
MSDTPTPPEYPAAPGSSDDTAQASAGPDAPDYAAAPAGPEDEPPMSTAETLSGVFFEPGRTFEHLRRRPRFLAAALVMIALTSAFVFLIYNRVSYEEIVRKAIESTPRTADMPAAQKEKVVAMQTGPIFKTIAYVSRPVGVLVYLFIGGALYLLGVMAMGKAVSYRQALSVWTYSSLPPYVLSMVANIILLFVKPAEEITPEDVQRGLARANLSVLVDPASRPVMATALGLFDVFAVYGLILAAVGVHKVSKLSSGSAWGVVLVIWLVGAVIRLAMATAFGIPLA